MRFICDVCPATALEGQTVIIGHYEQWIRHLLSPQHQVEQNLTMARTSFFPRSDWVALIKNLPQYSEATGELFVDLLMNLSEYGFVEALYYGSKMKDTACVALQLYETNAYPSYLKSPEDGTKYELKVAPRIPMDFVNEQKKSKMGKRRLRYHSISSTVSDASTVCRSFTNVATSPIASSSSVKDIDTVDSRSKMKDLDNGKRNRIKYDRDTLLKYYDQTSMPVRLLDIITLNPIIIEEPEFIDPERQRQIDLWPNLRSARTNSTTPAFNKNGSRHTTGYDRSQCQQRQPRQQGGWNV